MRYLTLSEVLFLHGRILAASGGGAGVRELHTLEAAIAQPKASFGGEDLYATAVEKAMAIGFSLVQGHPFIDGNKRIGHAAMEAFLALNGYVIDADVDEQERVMIALASGKLSREELAAWLGGHSRPA